MAQRKNAPRREMRHLLRQTSVQRLPPNIRYPRNIAQEEQTAGIRCPGHRTKSDVFVGLVYVTYGQLRCFREVTQQRSAEVTHPWNRIEDPASSSTPRAGGLLGEGRRRHH